MARGIPKADVYRVVAPKRTVERRQTQKRLSPSESDRTERLARIFALASTVLGNDDRAIRWLSTKKRRFEDERPLDLMESSLGADLVESVLLQAYFGNVASLDGMGGLMVAHLADAGEAGVRIIETRDEQFNPRLVKFGPDPTIHVERIRAASPCRRGTGNPRPLGRGAGHFLPWALSGAGSAAGSATSACGSAAAAVSSTGGFFFARSACRFAANRLAAGSPPLRFRAIGSIMP